MSKRQRLVCAAACAAAWLAAGSAVAAPVTYTGFTVTDVSLNGIHYHNAAVTLTFVGDTANVATFNGMTGIYANENGTASVQIVSGATVLHATFASGQVFVSLDQNNGGFGFSSFVGASHTLEPAYPLGIDGNINPNGLNDLVTPIVQSGAQWSCIGFPIAYPQHSGHCGNPAAYPLATDHGPFVIYMPYYSMQGGKIVDDIGGALNNALFTIQLP